MRRTRAESFVVVVAFLLLSLSGCKKETQVKSLSVDELASELKSGTVNVYDANMPEYRAQNGIIPGAIPLRDQLDYEPSEVLPPDKKAAICFYCVDNLCMSSHVSAGRAIEAGYTNVAVLNVGLKGWKAAGQPVTMIQ